MHVLLFGSRTQGDYGAHSDIDLLVFHAEESVVFVAWQQAAREAKRALYNGHISAYKTLVSPKLSASCNLDLITLLPRTFKKDLHSLKYSPSQGEIPSRDSHKLECLERALHARVEFSIV